MSKIKELLAAVAAILATTAAIFISGKRAGRKDAESDSTKKQVKAVEKAKEVTDNVNKKTDSAVSDELKHKWVRRE